jgi:hypothetical protein
MVQKQNQTIDGLVHHPNWGLCMSGELLKRFADERKRGLCCHSPQLFPKD